MESVLLGDPFNFLSNVPNYLSNLPSCSIFRQLYRSGLFSQVFRRLGARRFLLFYTFLPDKQIRLRPNLPASCCLLAGDEMGKEILVSAKQILSEQSREQQGNSNEVVQLRREMEKIKLELACLGDISQKIDQLLKRK